MKTRRLYIGCIVVGCGAAPSETSFFLFFFGCKSCFCSGFFCCCALPCFCQPARLTRPFQTTPPALSFLTFLALLLFLHFFFLASPVFVWSQRCTFLYLRRRAFTCVGALLLSSPAPAVSAQSSRLQKMACGDGRLLVCREKKSLKKNSPSLLLI